MPAFNPRTIIDGEPGERWQNDTGRPAWQLECSLILTCSYCLPLHLQISSRPWPVPFHGHCRCRNVLIRVGATAPFAFADHAKLIADLDETRRVIAIGRSADKLVRAGVIGLDKIVTSDRVRSIVEVVAKYRIPLKTLIAAGIAASAAGRIYREAKAATSRDWAAHHRRQLDEKIAAAHEAHEAVARHIAGAMPPTVAAPVATIPAAAPLGQAESRRRHAAELAALLALPMSRREKQLTPEERRVVEREVGPSAARSVAAFVAEIVSGLAAGKVYGDAVAAIYRKYAGR